MDAFDAQAEIRGRRARSSQRECCWRPAGVAAQQPPHWRFFTSSDGLRESWVLDVTPGSNGRWWITHGNVDALTVFDGYTIRQLPSPGATVTVREGPTGQLWSLLPHPTALDVYVGAAAVRERPMDRVSAARPARDGRVDAAVAFHAVGERPRAGRCVPTRSSSSIARRARRRRVFRAADTGLGAFTELTPAADGGAWIGGRGAIGHLRPPGAGAARAGREPRPAGVGAPRRVVQIHEARPDAVFASVQTGGARAVLRIDRP